MPACPCLQWVAVAVFSLSLAACERAAPPAAAAAAPADCLARSAVEPPPLPWVSLHARELAGAALDAAGRACIAGVLGDTPFGTPLAYDADYAPVQAFHGEDGALRIGAPALDEGLLVRLETGPERGIWLLRLDTGLEMEGGRYDLLFTTGADRRLRDSLLIGADGVLYRRDANLLRADRFAVIEQTGREDTQGPAYAAAFAIDPDGRIGLDASGTAELRSALPAETEAEAADDGTQAASSLEEIDGAPGDLAAIRRLLFSDAAVVEESIMQPGPPAAAHTVLALGGTDVAGLVLFVLEPVRTQPAPDRTVYRVASLTVPEPARVLGATVGPVGWAPDGDGAVITLPVDYAFERPGGHARTGEPESEIVPRVVRVRYADGQLRRIGD